MNTEIFIQVGTSIVWIGIFIGVTRNSLMQIGKRLDKIEAKLDATTEGHSQLRERVAVLESKLHN